MHMRLNDSLYGIENEESKHSFKDDIMSVIDLLRDRRMRRLLPQLCWTGISIAVYTGLLVPTIVDTIKGD